MTNFRKLRVAVVAAAVAALLVPGVAYAKKGSNIGTLRCAVDGGVGLILASSKEMNCVFKRTNGRSEEYVGRISKLGVDIGVTNATDIVWAVFATGKAKRGALAGSYTGASAEATVGVGLGTNVLIGGFQKTISLQPVSIQGQRGLNVAAGIAALRLERAD